MPPPAAMGRPFCEECVLHNQQWRHGSYILASQIGAQK